MKKRLIKFFCLFLTVLLLVVWSYNNLTLKTVEASLASDKAKDEIRIALISDLHYSFIYNNNEVISRVKETKPDIIFVLGDMYSRGMTGRIDNVISFLEKLSDIADIYAVTGDHDYDDEYKQKINNLEKMEIIYRLAFLDYI